MAASPQHLPTRPRSRLARLAGGALALSLVTVLLATPAPAQADSAVAPASGSLTVRGAGFGHGYGMSQYGAYGAALRGLEWREILDFYYPGTTRKTLPSSSSIRVWLTADSDGSLWVRPTAGLRVVDRDGHGVTLPTGKGYTGWRISRAGAGYRLAYRTADGAWKTRSTPLSTSTWSFTAGGKVLTLVRPGGSTRTYRGTLALVKRGSSGRTVNTVRLEDYVRAVVPVEMPTSWATDAVRTQAVAARSYAVRLRDFASYDGYDICDTTACQVYGGRSRETARGDDATRATAGVILTYGGKVALTQFSSSNGGAMKQSSLPYMVAKPDPYDGVVTSQAWTRTITAASIARAWPSVGTVLSVQITRRDGSGAWGGRVETIVINGSKGRVSLAGTTFQSRFGMRSSLYRVGGAVPADPATVPPAPTVSTPTAARGAAYASFPRPYDAKAGAELAVLVGGTLYRYPVARGMLGSPAVLATGMGGASLLLHAGDWDGDGFQDLLTRRSDGSLLLHRGSATGLRAGVALGAGRGLVAVAAPGDLSGDGRPDLVATTRSGTLRLYRGDGATGVKAATTVGRGWQDRDTLRSAGDLTGDGRPDLLSQRGSTLLLSRGTARGFAAPVAVTGRWSGYAALAAVGDLTGDRRGDLVARRADGRLVLFRGDGSGGFGSGTLLAGDFSGTRFAV